MCRKEINLTSLYVYNIEIKHTQISGVFYIKWGLLAP